MLCPIRRAITDVSERTNAHTRPRTASGTVAPMPNASSRVLQGDWPSTAAAIMPIEAAVTTPKRRMRQSSWRGSHQISST
jgi:hypothetical protein